MTEDDAAFIVELLNDADFLRYIGDRGVRTVEDARAYIANGPLDSYARHGFGLLTVELRETGTPVGICGLLKRPTLPDVDIGFAFLPRHRARGYALESATAVMRHARETLGLGRIVAICDPDNGGSIRILERIGMRFERRLRTAEGEPEVCLYSSDRG
jgi:RimJ/RimL family protein N-acetyltransferase